MKVSRHHEGEQASREDARHHLRQVDAPEHGERATAERLGRSELRGLDRAHHAIDRQKREGELDMRHRDDEAGPAIHQFEAIGRQAEPEQEVVEQAVFL